MKELTTLIPALNGLIGSEGWASAVSWTFWFLLFVIAAGGLFFALLGKGSLINRSICGTLNLAVIYLAVIGIYYIIVGWRTGTTELPFLSVDQNRVILVNPLSLGLKALVPVLTRFMMLTMLVHSLSSLCHSSSSVLTWTMLQCIAALVSWGFYTVLCIGLDALSPSLLNKWSIIPLVLFWGLFVLYWITKLLVLLWDPANKHFTKIHTFLTTNRVGSVFTKTALTTFEAVGLLWLLNYLGYSQITFNKLELFSMLLIGCMFTVTLYIFSMVFADKKAK